MKAQELVKKAKIRLLLNNPFFATIALCLEFIEDTTIKTACTNGKYIKYNPLYIESFNLAQIVGLIAHEIFHIILLHHTRRGTRNHEIWNIAADHAINLILVDAGFQLPSGAVLNYSFKGLNAEQIYNLIYEEEKDKKHEKSPGEVEDAPNKKEAEAETKKQIAQATDIAQAAGKMPGELQKIVNEILTPVINWQEILFRFMDEIAHNDQTWNKPNRNYLPKFYLPTMENREIGNIIFTIDVSGSIDENKLNHFISELTEVRNIINFDCLVIQVNTQIVKISDLSEDLEIKRGGGTDFRPAFRYIEENDLNPTALIYFTDGQCSRYSPEPFFPVLWAKYGNYNFRPPYGEVININ